MAESLKTVLMSALTSKATPAENDTLIVGEGNTLKKISFSQLFTYLKDKLEINALNTKLANIIYIWYTSKTFESISTGNSSEWHVSVPAKAGYTRFAVLVQKVSGSGSNSAIVNIHGDMPDKMISVHAGGAKLTNVTVVIAAIYIKDGFISVIKEI